MTREEQKLKAADEYIHKRIEEGCGRTGDTFPAFVEGVEWADSTSWKSVDGDDLPEIDKEVIALVCENEHYKVVFAHRPQEYWDGRNIDTGKVTRYYPKRYDKGGWNIPDVKWWLDIDLPKMEE